MKNIYFLDVDTQRDFMTHDGARYVLGAERIIPKLRRLFDFARNNEVTILSSVHAYRPDDPEFKSSPPYCIRGTEGQRKIDDTLLPRPLIIENKPTDRNVMDVIRKSQQIIIEKQSQDIFANRFTGKLIRVLPPHAFVFGLSTQQCVKLAALGLRAAGVKTVVISDAICALNPADGAQSGEEAIQEMRGRGVDFIPTDTLMGVLIS